MDCLARGVPLSLLLDLSDADGPDSRAILDAERPAVGAPGRRIVPCPRKPVRGSLISFGPRATA